MFLQQPLDRHRQLAQETLEDGSAFSKLILYFYFQHVGGQGDEAEALRRQTGGTGEG